MGRIGDFRSPGQGSSPCEAAILVLMRFCTRMTAVVGDDGQITDADVLDISLVDDGHQAGFNEVAGELHWPGGQVNMVDTPGGSPVG